MKLADKPLLFACLAMAVGCLFVAGQVVAVQEHGGTTQEHAGKTQEHAGAAEEVAQDRVFETSELEQLSAETFAGLDLDGNGVLEATEWVKGIGSPELFAVKDRDGDGVISIAEAKEMEVDAGAGSN